MTGHAKDLSVVGDGRATAPLGAAPETEPAHSRVQASAAEGSGFAAPAGNSLHSRIAWALQRAPEELAQLRTLPGIGPDAQLAIGVLDQGRLDVRLLTPAEFALLAGHLSRTLEQGGAAEPKLFPLSPPQQRLWFLEQLTPGTAAYCLPMAARLRGALDVSALESGLNAVLARHQALRTSFADYAGEASQVVASQLRLSVPVVDLRYRSAEQREAAAVELATEFARRPFDLAHGPLLRATVLRLSAHDHLFVMVGHHIVIDGWAIRVLFEELALGYDAALRGAEPAFGQPPLQYPDITLRQLEFDKSPEVRRQLDYWKAKLAGAPVLLELPTDRPRPAVQRFRGATRNFAFPAELLEGLRRLSREEGATLFMTMLAAFNVLLGRYSGQGDVVVGTPVANRAQPELHRVIGFFANTLALRSDLSGDPTFRELLERVRQTCLDAYVHQEVPFERVIDVLELPRALSHQLVFQVVFALQSTVLSDLKFPGLEADPVELDSGASRFDLAFSLSEADDGLHCAVEYSTDLFDDATIEHMAERYQVLLESVVADPACAIGRLPLRTAAEQDWHEEWNATGTGLQQRQCLHRVFEDRVARAPDAIALTCGERQIGYGTLNERANRLAYLLQDRGVGPEVRVGVFLERSVESIVALLAVLKSGGVYLPLDPGYPPDRLEYVLADAGVRVLLTTENLVERLPDRTAEIVCLDRDRAEISAHSAVNPASETCPDQLAYLIYTSGSTGRPKGAMMAHRGLANLVEVESRALAPEPGDRVLQVASFSFDASLWDVVMALPFGGTLCVATGEQRLPGDDLARLMAEQGITHATLAPSALAVLPTEAAPHLRVLTSTGEALPPEVVDRWAVGRRLINGYGPTESTVGATTGDCLPGERQPHLGRPFAHTQVHLLDPWMRPVPFGVPGELFIGGEGLSRGYLGRPGLSAERFVPNPFSSVPGARLYRTGDRARFLADGKLVFQGRLDDQIQLRGFRIELGEVEAAVRTHPAVTEVSVVAQQDGVVATRLIAYVAADAGTTAGQLRAHCAERLPDYMVPSAVVVMDGLPHTPNGKIDRRALPEPDADVLGSEESYTPPRSAEEAALAGIWAELLGVGRVGRDDNFFALGGDSIMSLQMVARAVEAGLPLSTKLVFQHGTVADLVAAVRPDSAPGPGSPATFPAAGLDGVELDKLLQQVPDLEDAYPPSTMQLGMLFHTEYAPESSVYRVQLLVGLEGPLDARALRTAWEQAVDRHAPLRTTFRRTSQDHLMQVVHRTVELPWTELDWRGLPEHELAGRLAELEARERARPFDLTEAPLLRLHLVRVADESYQMVWTMHHALLDGWSLPIVLRELLSLYGGVRRGGGVVLPVVRPYRDFVAWLGGLDGGLAEGVWREALAGVVAPTVLPWDPPVVARAGVDSVVVEVPEVVVDGVRGLCRGLGVTLGTVVQAGWGLLLARHAGQSDVVFGATVSGRPAQLAGVESMVGMFINTLPVRVRVDEGAPVGEWLRGLQGLLVELREFEHTPLTQIQGWSEVPRGTGLFQSLVVVENLPLGQMGSGGGPDAVVVRQVRVADETDTPLTLVAAPGEGLELRLLFQQMHYDHAGARRLLDELVCVLAGFAAGQSRPLGRVGLIERAGELERVAALNPDRAGFEQAVAPVTLFTRQVCSRPDAVALVWGERQYSYQVLHARARSIAGRLPAGSVGPERLCAVLLERSPEQVAAVLAVQLAGGAYLPIDTAYPAERIGYLLTDSGCPVLITTRALAREIPEHALAAVSLVLLDEPTTEQEGAAGQDPITAQQGADGGVAQVVPLARQLAYVIYTSGSTGHPKGVMIEHQQAARLFAAAQREFGFDDRDVWTLFHSLAFDFSVWELWGALIHGARLVLVDEPTRRSPTDLRALVAEQAVTVLNQTPSAFAPLAETILADGPDAHALRAIVFGGEALPTDRLAPWAEHIGTTRPALINMYGITETTVHVTHHALTPRDLTPDSPSVIGRPLADLHTYLLDARGHQVPTGVTGEIHVTGPGLARGYLHRPALTAQRFLPDPYATTPGARTYRTGDLARAAHDGTLYYQGRTDHQIKLRGYRIELGEIEQTLRTHPDVEHAHVQLREDTPGDKRLVAYLTPTHPETDPDTLITTLRTHAHTHLPPYMAPTAYLVLDHLPLTPHGKTDTKALPAPTHDRTGIDTTYQPPQTDTETRLAHLWTTTLHTTPIGRHDNFFTLGGDSILATVLQSRIRSVLDVELPLRVVFGSPDLAALATAIDDHASSTGAQQASAPSLAPVARGSFSPLSFGQQRFWFLEQWQPNTPLYHISGALRLTGELNAAVLQRSVDSLVARHEMLRTRLVDVAGERSQCVLASDRVPVPVVDLTGLPAAQRPTAALRLVQSAAETPFPLDGGPLWRLVLVRVAPAEHHLAVCLHHLVADGQSLTLLLDELGENYGILRARREVRRPSLPVQYGDYAVWQRDHLQGERLERELGYWRRTLAGLADVTLPTERPRPDEQTYDSATYELDLPAQVASGLPDLGRRANATPFMALFAAGAVALGQACELDDVVMGTPVANRTRPELEGLIGYLANTVVLRLRSGGCTTFEQLLDLARTVCLEAYDHAEVPFERVVHDLRPERTASHLPLFQAWFVVQDELQVATAFDGLAVEPASAIPRLARYDLRLEFRRGAEGLRLVCEYKTALFTAARIERLGRYLATALMQAVANPGLPLDELARRIRAAEDERQDRAAEAAAVYSAGALKRRRRTAHGTTETG